MALRKRTSRRITVDGCSFRYTVNCDWDNFGEHDIRITIQNSANNGRKLLIRRLRGKALGEELDDSDLSTAVYPVITPKHIASLIKRAINIGWAHTSSGKDFYLPENER
jgi:hypothetical protein